MLLGLTALFVADPAQAEEDAVRAAIVSAVRARAGAVASVEVDLRVAALTPGIATVDAAEPQAGARFGRPARFRLITGGRTVGYAIGVVHATVPLLRVTHAIAAGGGNHRRGRAVGRSAIRRRCRSNRSPLPPTSSAT